MQNRKQVLDRHTGRIHNMWLVAQQAGHDLPTPEGWKAELLTACGRVNHLSM